MLSLRGMFWNTSYLLSFSMLSLIANYVERCRWHLTQIIRMKGSVFQYIKRNLWFSSDCREILCFVWWNSLKRYMNHRSNALQFKWGEKGGERKGQGMNWKVSYLPFCLQLSQAMKQSTQLTIANKAAYMIGHHRSATCILLPALWSPRNVPCMLKM